MSKGLAPEGLWCVRRWPVQRPAEAPITSRVSKGEEVTGGGLIESLDLGLQ